MIQIIREVLEDMADGQINLASEAARKTIANLISAALKTKGVYTEYGDDEIEEQEARDSWVCSICGKNTFDVDYEYIGSGTNHLGCELKDEIN
jgi:rubrerythrin